MNKCTKTKDLTSILQNHFHNLFIACSGGLDSRFLAYFARYIGINNIQLLHIVGAHIDPSETLYLKEWAKKNSFSLHLIPVHVLEKNEIQYNHPLRCYHCKYMAFSTMYNYIKENFSNQISTHIYREHEIILHDGTHFDDTKVHRPGLLALKELNIQSPLALAGFTKKDILEIALKIKLENPMQKSKPCLLTRFAYNTQITFEKLHFIAEAEKIVESIFLEKFGKNNTPVFRIREVSANMYEIHTLDILPKLLIETLQTTLKNVNIINKFRINTIEHKTVEILSGYFDRIQKKRISR